jgi:hypothetical protein
MMESFICLWLMAKVSILIQKDPLIKALGSLINNMGQELKNGRMGVGTQVNFMKDLNKVLVRSFGALMVLSIKESGFKIRCTDLDNISGQMGDSIQDIGV